MIGHLCVGSCAQPPHQDLGTEATRARLPRSAIPFVIQVPLDAEFLFGCCHRNVELRCTTALVFASDYTHYGSAQRKTNGESDSGPQRNRRLHLLCTDGLFVTTGKHVGARAVLPDEKSADALMQNGCLRYGRRLSRRITKRGRPRNRRWP